MHRKLVIGLIACLGVEFAPAAHSACRQNDVEVIKTSSSYQVGSCLTTRTYLSLKEREWIVLQPKEGKTRLIYGPYLEKEKKPKKSDEKKSNKKDEGKTLIEKIIETVRKRAPPSNCGVWEIDALEDNAFCFEFTKGLNLCRAHSTHTDTLIIKGSNTDQQYQDNWLHDDNGLKAWPLDAFPVSDGAVYRVSIRGKIRKLTFHQVPAPLSGSYETEWMLDNKCYRQVDLRWPERHPFDNN